MKRLWIGYLVGAYLLGTFGYWLGKNPPTIRGRETELARAIASHRIGRGPG